MSDARIRTRPPGFCNRYLAPIVLIIASFAVVPPPARGGRQRDREKAVQAWEKAQLLRQRLAGNPEAERGGYLELARTCRSVYYSDPRFYAADDAVFEEGRAYQQIGEKFGDARSLARAVRTFRFLLENYPSSGFCREARERLAALGEPPAEAGRAEGAGGKDRAAEKPGGEPAVQAGQRGPQSGPAVVRGIRYHSDPGLTRVSIDLDRPVPFESSRISDPERFFFDLSGATPAPELRARSIEVGDAFLQRIRMAPNRPGVLRIVLDLNGRFDCSISREENPFRIVLEIPGRRSAAASAGAVPQASSPPADAPKDAPAGRPASGHAPVAAAVSNLQPVLQIPAAVQADRFTAVRIPDFMQAAAGPVTLPARESAPQWSLPAAALPAMSISAVENTLLPRAAAPTSAGDRTLARALGLKIGRVVIDPGHGGHDLGTVGPDGLAEKDLVLEVARTLRRLLEDRLGAEVILTREEDVFIPLEERTALANQHRADLFISIHANSSSSKETSGVETYFLDFARSAAERAVAARENAVALLNYRDLENLVWKIARADKMAESRELASAVQESLYGSARQVFPAARNRGVRSAPFIVLIGAKMPSVLVEVAFLSNPRDERLLRRENTRQQIARALFQGIEGYMKALGSEIALTQSNGAP